jgi:hypothetical protein
MTPFDPRTQEEPGNNAIIQHWFIISDELLFSNPWKIAAL